MLTQQVPLCHSLTLFACSADLPIQASTQETAPVPMTISTTEQDENTVATSSITVPMDIDITIPPTLMSMHPLWGPGKVFGKLWGQAD